MNNSTKEQVWFITGSGRGIGYSLTKYLLENGQKVHATSRNISPLEDLKTQFPNSLSTQELDVTKLDKCTLAIQTAIDSWGRIDVLVNNAGYGLLGAAEEQTEEDIRLQMEVNFFGMERLCRLALPNMRKNGKGVIFNISSIAGIKGTPLFSYYNASKFAMEGFSEALAGEVASFGIDVCLIEPGPYRTDWAGPSLVKSTKLTTLDADSPYLAVNTRMHQIYQARHGTQPGDPLQIAKIILELANQDSIPLRVIMGSIAVDLFKEKIKNIQDPKNTFLISDSQTSIH